MVLITCILPGETEECISHIVEDPTKPNALVKQAAEQWVRDNPSEKVYRLVEVFPGDRM